MAEVIPLLDIKPDYTTPRLGEVIISSGFLDFRVHPRLKQESAVPNHPAGSIATLAHLFSPGGGYMVPDMKKFMEERLIRPPLDIREILALGPQLTDEELEYAIYAPHLTGSDNPETVLKIIRHRGWQGIGLVPSTINSDDNEYPSDFTWIGFSVA
jgi:hypothetical protein